MADDVTAPGIGTIFRSFSDSVRQWGGSVVSFVTGGTPGAWTLQGVADADSQRLPVKPVVRGPVVDHKGTIATGGQSQTALAANAARNYLIFQNPSTATETMWINFSAAATMDAGSIELGPGASYERDSSSHVSPELITIIAATPGHAYCCKEG